VIRTLQLDASERDQLDRLADGIASTYADFAAFAYDCWRAGAALPERLARALHGARQGMGGPLLLKGMPMPRVVPPTPTRRGDTWSEASLRARALMALTLSPLGHLFNLRERQSFDVIDDVFPIYSDRDAQVGTNRCFLEWHVEDGFHPAKADLLALYCLRGDPAAGTHLCEARELDLSAALRTELEQPQYLLRTDPTMASDAPSLLLPVLTPGADPEIVYDPAYMTGMSSGATEALVALRHAVERAAQRVTLEAGDLLILDNRRVLHARGEYRPAYDGTDRWLLRALLADSLWPRRGCLDQIEYGHRPSRPNMSAPTVMPC